MNKKILYSIVGIIVVCVLGYMVWPNTPLVVENTAPETEATSTTVTKSSGTVKKTTQSVKTAPKATYTVLYTKEGFEPSELQIPKGATVKFVNKTNTSMRIFASDTAKPPYSDLNQPKALGLNGEYMFNFVYVGVWEYYNSLKPSDKANIVVY